MAPRGGGRQRDSAEPQALYELGIRGRKTGLTLHDTGARDEYGMQPLEDLLSSPERTPFVANGRDSSSDANDSGSDDMDLETSAGPGPRTLLKDRRSYPIPRSRSPLKTNLMSPARKNPHLERVSSPTRGSVVEELEPTVTRKLDFAGNHGRARGKPNGVNGTFREEDEDEVEEDEVQDDEDEDADDNNNTENTVIHQSDDEDNSDLLEESLQMVEAMAGSTPTPEPEAPPAEQEEEPVVRQSAAKKKGRGRPPKVAPKPIVEELPEEPSEDPSDEEEPQPVAPKRRGRPAKKDSKPKEPAPAQISRKRRSPQKSADNEQDVNDEPEPEGSASQPKRQRISQPKASKPEPAKPAPAKAAAPKAEPKPRGRPGRKPKVQGSGAEGDVGETSFAALQRGPPMPKSRGLVSVRHDADAVRQTRSGRHSYRPLDYWRGEQVIQEEEEMDNMFAKDRFVLPTIKEVIRVPEELPPSKRAPRSKARSKATAKQRPIHPEEEELEDWEINPGTVTGEVIIWEPEHELQPPADDEPVEVMEERVAVSADAIQTKDIRDASFRFAKTLTTPFMGAGVVDLPPGAEKRPKNSRKMHMVFFVHFGKVLVTVNEAQFRITAGGMWFVPRGNYYSITNDYDNPSRIFFSQACEMSNQYYDPDQSQNSTMALS